MMNNYKLLTLLAWLVGLLALVFSGYALYYYYFSGTTDITKYTDSVQYAYNENQFDVAVTEARAAYDVSQGNPEDALLLAAALAQRGKYKNTSITDTPEAMRIVEQVLAQDSTNAEAHRILGYTYETLGKYASAQEEYETALSLAKSPGLVYLDLARLNQILGNTDVAYKQYLEAAAAGVDYGRTQLGIGRIYIEQGDIAHGEEAFRGAYRSAQSVRVKAEAAYELGLVMLNQEEYTQAQAFMQQSIDADSTYALAHIGFAKVLLDGLHAVSDDAQRTNAVVSAFEHVQKSLELDTRATIAYIFKGRILENAGQKESAHSAYVEAGNVLELDTSLNPIQRIELKAFIDEGLENTVVTDGSRTAIPSRNLIAGGGGGGGGGGGCFVADTKVLLADGSTKLIQDVAVGDSVIGQNGSINTVIETFRPLLGNRNLYSINGSDAFVTGGHPFLGTDGVWHAIDVEEAAKENPDLIVLPLVVGERIITTHGARIVTDITAITEDPSTQLYNFHTDNTSTFVADDFVVHNKGGGGGGGSAGSGDCLGCFSGGINFDFNLPAIPPSAPTSGTTIPNSCEASQPNTNPDGGEVDYVTYTKAERTFTPNQRSALGVSLFTGLFGQGTTGCYPLKSGGGGRGGGGGQTTTHPCYPDNATANYICKTHGWEWGVESIQTSETKVSAAYSFGGALKDRFGRGWTINGEEPTTIRNGRFGGRTTTPPKDVQQIESVTCNAPPSGTFFVAGNACAGGQCYWGNNPNTPNSVPATNDMATYFCRVHGYETFTGYESRPKSSAAQGHVIPKVTPYPPTQPMTPAEIIAAAKSEVTLRIGDSSCTSNCWYRFGVVSCKLPPEIPISSNNPPASCEVTPPTDEEGGGDMPVDDAMTITVTRPQEACYLGEQTTLQMVGSDPVGENIRYALDWNADDVVDEYVPSQGYVESGTMQEVVYIYTEETPITVRVRTENHSGSVSPWSETVTFTCEDNRPPDFPSVSSNGQCVPDEPYSFTIESTHPAGKSLFYEIDSNRDGSVDQRIPVSGLTAPGAPQTVEYTFPQGNYALSVRAVDGDGRISNWNTIMGSCGVSGTTCPACVNGAPDVAFSAQPALVTPGQTTQLHWSISGLDSLQSCTITGANGQIIGWDTISSLVSQETLPITGPTTYTFTCSFAGIGDVSKQLTVLLVPVWQEF